LATRRGKNWSTITKRFKKKKVTKTGKEVRKVSKSWIANEQKLFQKLCLEFCLEFCSSLGENELKMSSSKINRQKEKRKGRCGSSYLWGTLRFFFQFLRILIWI
jgi:hypothetical protein